MNKALRSRGMWAASVLAVASLALVGCGGSDESADDDTTTTTEAAAEETTTTVEETTTTAAPETTTTAAPVAAEPLVFPTDNTARITVDTTDVSVGDTITASATGFAPNASLATSMIEIWPPGDMPGPDYMVTYLPDVAVADASGAATVSITVDQVCATGPCYAVVADGIGPNGIYAGVELNVT